MPRAGGTPLGGHSSGSYAPAPGPVTRAADNKVLWIVLGVVAAAAIIAIIVVATSGGDGGGGDSGGGAGGPAESGFSPEIEEEFISSCTASGGTDATCGCAWDLVTETISVERFAEIEAELLEDPEADVPELDPILEECAGAT